METAAHWGDLTGFMVAGTLTDEVVRLRNRYSADAASAAVRDLQARDLLDGRYQPSSVLQTVIDAINVARTDAATASWSGSADLALIVEGAATMLAGGVGPLAAPYRELPEPEDLVQLLWHRLIGLRYVRADAHAQAWGEIGFSATEIVALTKARDGETVDSPPPGLVERGFLTSAGEITENGRAVRKDIEQTTNRLSAPAYFLLGDEAWSTWMAAMRSLPPHS